jgi:hypothetical protein
MQPQTEAERKAEEAEGQRLRDLFQAGINQQSQRSASKTEQAIPMLTERFPQLKNDRKFFNLVEAYSLRGDMTKRFSSIQIIAYAAAERLMGIIDMPPKDFLGMFTFCCHIAGTHLPEKPKGK